MPARKWGGLFWATSVEEIIGGVTATVSHFIAVEFILEVLVVLPIAALSAVGVRAVVTVVVVEVIIDMATEVVTAVKPRAGSDEDAA